MKPVPEKPIRLGGVPRDEIETIDTTDYPTIRLLTRDGQFVKRIRTMPWVYAPEIIRWGERHFVLQENGEYREGFCWPAVFE